MSREKSFSTSEAIEYIIWPILSDWSFVGRVGNSYADKWWRYSYLIEGLGLPHNTGGSHDCFQWHFHIYLSIWCPWSDAVYICGLDLCRLYPVPDDRHVGVLPKDQGTGGDHGRGTETTIYHFRCFQASALVGRYSAGSDIAEILELLSTISETFRSPFI